MDETGWRPPSDEVKRIEALSNALDVGIMIYDRNDTLIATSSHFLRYFDVDPELLQPGARLRDLFHATYDAGALVLGSRNGQARQISREDWIAERVAIHWRERYESVEQLSDGRWIRLRKRRMPDGLLIATSEDITEQRNNQKETAELLKSADTVMAILDSLDVQVIVKDAQLRYVMVNDSFCKVFGLPRKYILGKKAADFVGPELAARFEELETSVLETGKPRDALEHIHSADGTELKVITRMRRTGTPGAYTVTISFDDITGLTMDTVVPTSHQIVPPPALEPESQPAVTPKQQPKGRVLVVDEDPERSRNHVGALKAAGFEAVSTSDADETLAFMEAAQAAALIVHKVEISAHMARSLSGEVKAGRHGILRAAIEQKLADEPVSRPAPVPVASPKRVSRSPVLSVVASAPAPVENVPDSTESVDQAAPAKSSEQPVEKTQSLPKRDPIRVLVAEDNDVNQIVFEQILEGIGVDYRIVNNGEEAVAAWRAATPDLIVMDISMPVMNGLQAVQAIRKAEASEEGMRGNVPVIAVTAHAMSGDRERCLAAGMSDYLSKPVSPEKLEAIIEKWVGSSERLRAVG